MCNHKPKFFKYYFANRYVKKFSEIEKEGYVCKSCGEKIKIEKKFIPYEFVVRILKYYLCCGIPLFLSFSEHFRKIAEWWPRLLVIVSAFAIYFVLIFVIELFFYFILKFSQVEE